MHSGTIELCQSQPSIIVADRKLVAAKLSGKSKSD
tara:strand:+ start:81 stop:185 length:105 start_codon:yes stop_codon:yes gene_type:complete